MITPRDLSRNTVALLTGATVMYFADPDRGKRRRAELKQKSYHYSLVGLRWIERRASDLAHRAQGAAARLRQQAAETPSDPVLEARVKSRLGRVVPRVKGLEVHADHGHVVLRGPLSWHEARKVIRTTNATPGVRDVEFETAKFRRRTEREKAQSTIQIATGVALMWWALKSHQSVRRARPL